LRLAAVSFNQSEVDILHYCLVGPGVCKVVFAPA
jgi:hypothetical protein